MHDSAQQGVILPRNLIILAFLWLVAAWAQTIGFRPPLWPTAPSYEPGVRLMVLFLSLGVTVAWPLYRLSQRRTGWAFHQTVLDLIVLLAMAQVVVWPLRLVTSWSRERTAAMDFSLIGWALVTGLIVAVSIGAARARWRAAGMIACMAIAFGAPTVDWLASRADGGLDAAAYMSPLVLMYELGSVDRSIPDATHWTAIVATLSVGVVGWLVAGLWLARSGPTGVKPAPAVSSHAPE